jgi:alkyl hydroperoxide reductase subunit AhpF
VTAEVQNAEVLDGAVRLTSARGADLTRTVLLATGMLDEVPDIPGFADLWGTSAHTCPYCDGFEHRDERLAVLAAGARSEHLAVLLRQWSDHVARTLGCQLRDDGSIAVDPGQATTVDRGRSSRPPPAPASPPRSPSTPA